MGEMLTIAGKEIRSILRSRRFLLGFLLTILLSLTGAYESFLTHRKQIELYGKGEGIEPTSLSAFSSSVWIVSNAMLPFLSIAISFDTIVRERKTGTMQLFLVRSISKVSIVIGKFLGGLAAVSIVSLSAVLIAGGLTIALIGSFSIEELARITAFTGMLLIYVSFWISISILISSVANSLSSSLFFSIFLLVSFSAWYATSVALSNLLAPLPSYRIVGDPWFGAILDLRGSIAGYINWLSPSAVFVEGASALLNPMIDAPPFTSMTAQPLPLDIFVTLKNVWPCFSAIVCMLVATLTVSCLILSVRGVEVEEKT